VIDCDCAWAEKGWKERERVGRGMVKRGARRAGVGPEGAQAERAKIASERARLFELIEERARAEKVPVTRVTREELGIGFSYYAALKSGAGNIGNSMEFLRRCAAYLERPLLQVLMYAGVVGIEDVATRLELKHYVDLGYFKISKDEDLGAAVPGLKEWEETPLAVKVLLVLVYEAYFAQKMALAGRAEPLGLPRFEAAEALLRRVPAEVRTESERQERKRG